MAQITKTDVIGANEVEETYEKRTGRFLFLFTTEWWEKVSQKHIGNDIYIKTSKEIRQVYLNDKPLINHK